MIADQLVQALGVEARHVAHDIDAAVEIEIAALVIALLHLLFFRDHRLKIHHREIAALGEIAFLVEHIGDAARHASGEIATGLADDDDDAAGHIFAAVIAGAFDDGNRAGITHGETFAGDAAEIAFARDGAVKHRIADDDRLLRHDRAISPADR